MKGLPGLPPVAVKLYLTVILFDIENLMWISFIYLDQNGRKNILISAEKVSIHLKPHPSPHQISC